MRKATKQSAGLKASNNRTAPTASNPPTPTAPTLQSGTKPSVEREWDHPWTAAQVKEAMGIDPDDPNVTVRFQRMGDAGLAQFFESVFAATDRPPAPEPRVTAAVTAKELEVLAEVGVELRRARALHDPMHSPHEGYAVLKEEVDELWEAIKDNDPTAARVEAIQVAAMAVRFLLDVVE